MSTSVTADLVAQARAAGRLAGLREAAEIIAVQEQEFLDHQYATPQPVGSISERFACRQCAEAIYSVITELSK